jgi:two-component system, OmpR family, alkaline phosphatase synthesis response regulator PhoP
MLTILVIDDDEMIGNIFSLSLKRMDATVQVVNNGSDALRIAQDLKPDLVFVDLLMPQPGMNGWQVIEAFRAQEAFRETIIIAVTGGSEHNIDRAIELGATDVIRKPFRFDQLKAMLEKHLTPEK